MRHIFALRMLNTEDYFQRPIEELFLYETDNSVLTIDDFIKINGNPYGYKLICYFYGGSMTIKNFTSKYNIPFRLDLIDQKEQ